jgi:hypothetical protein
MINAFSHSLGRETPRDGGSDHRFLTGENESDSGHSRRDRAMIAGNEPDRPFTTFRLRKGRLRLVEQSREARFPDIGTNHVDIGIW